jgi:hypothetical protein
MIKIGSMGITLPMGEMHPLARRRFHEDTDHEGLAFSPKQAASPGWVSQAPGNTGTSPKNMKRVACTAFMNVNIQGNTRNGWKLPDDYPEGVRFSIDLGKPREG